MKTLLDGLWTQMRLHVDFSIRTCRFLCTLGEPEVESCCKLITDIERRSQNSYTALCNGVASHGAQMRYILVFADHTCENKRKQNASTIFACHAAFKACLSSSLDRITCVPDELRLFQSRENPNTLNLSPMLE